MAAKRSILRINLDTAAEARLEAICLRRGMTQVSCTSRLVNWFSDQDIHIQNAVLIHHTAATIAPVTKLLLKKLAQADQPAVDSARNSMASSG